MVDVLYKDKDWLYKKYVIEGLPIKRIAEIAGCGTTTILRWLKKFRIETRPRSYCLPSPVVDEYFYEVLDGIMLSDGCLNMNKRGKNARFRFDQSIDHCDYVYW